MAHNTSAVLGTASYIQAPPSLYAEFLPKLGRISIVVHLPSLSTYQTKALISADAKRLIVDHEGIITELTLPVKTSISGEHLPGEIPPGHEEVSWRLRPHRDELLANGQRRLDLTGDAVPWSAADLKPRVDIMCRECKTVIVSKDSLREWKDLPSENWAEMMEFWHCHKPITNDLKKTHDASGQGTEDETRASDNELASRGYGANSAIVAQQGVGFVDLTKMLFHGEDWKDLMMSSGPTTNPSSMPPPSPASPAAACVSCAAHLGFFDFRKNGVLLFKWKLAIRDPASNTLLPDPPTLSQCLAAALVATHARSGSAKVVLQGDEEAITIWVLNPHIKFSCKAKQKVPAIKLLFRNTAMDEEEINLPDEVVKEVRDILEESTQYLPPDEKTKKMFNGQDGVWKVALLERIER